MVSTVHANGDQVSLNFIPKLFPHQATRGRDRIHFGVVPRAGDLVLAGLSPVIGAERSSMRGQEYAPCSIDLLRLVVFMDQENFARVVKSGKIPRLPASDDEHASLVAQAKAAEFEDGVG